jgi:hypothetical protein
MIRSMMVRLAEFKDRRRPRVRWISKVPYVNRFRSSSVSSRLAPMCSYAAIDVLVSGMVVWSAILPRMQFEGPAIA